jgi:predicted DNA-binding ribbon-helix-helix protein
MCQVYAMTDPILYESQSRSVRIRGVVTGIRLENLFWQLLLAMAQSEGMTTNQLIVKLHEEIGHHRGEVSNFTSFLRVTCLRYQALRADEGKPVQAVAALQERETLSAMAFPLETISWPAQQHAVCSARHPSRKGSPAHILAGFAQGDLEVP